MQKMSCNNNNQNLTADMVLFLAIGTGSVTGTIGYQRVKC